jgi:hypothetical protein
MYSIEVPASGGASINNDTEGFGWFSGVATGVLPWRGPIIGFRAAALNDALIDGGDTLDVNVTSKASALDFTSTEKANLATTAEIKTAVAPFAKNVGKTIRFPMHASTSPYALATGLTVTAVRSIDGAAFAAGTLSAVAEVGSGLYEVEFANADMNGDCIALLATATGARPTLLAVYPV